MVSPIPDFDTAVARLRNFIQEVGHPPGELVWVFREDVSTYRRRVLIKIPLPVENERVARRRFEEGRRVGIGVCLSVFCRLGDAYCCTTWFVSDLEESARKLCYGLKLSVPAPADLDSARAVQGRLVWAVRRWLDGTSQFPFLRDFLPARGNDRTGL